MLCRALFAAVVVSYVLCVLLLSGVQRDDLDEGTLRKLQRHNVNIADIDDRKLREQCFVENETSTLTPEQVHLKEEENKTTAKPITSEFDGDVASQTQFKKLFDYFKKQEAKNEVIIKETTMQPPAIQSGNIIDFNTLPSSVRYRIIKDIADSVTELSQNTTSKKENNAKTVNDDQDKAKPLPMADKTHHEIKTPSITNETPINENTNNVGYISKIVSQILNQKQLNQVQNSSVPFELNAKPLIQSKDLLAAEDSSRRTNLPSNYYLNTFNVNGTIKNIEADVRAKNKEESEIIASILNQLRHRDRLPAINMKESVSEYDQYVVDRQNSKQLKPNLKGEQKRAFDFENIDTLTGNILSRNRNVPDNNQQLKNNWPLDINSGSAKAFGTYLQDPRSPPINQINERDKTINENYPSVNEEYQIKWPYYMKNLGKKRELIPEMEQRIAINALNGRYLTINNKNDRNDDDEYKHTETYFLANNNNKHVPNLEDKAKISSFDQLNDNEKLTKTLVGIRNNPIVESQYKSKWLFDDQNVEALGSKSNKQQNNALMDRPYDRRDTIINKNDRSAQPIDYDDQRIEADLGLAKKKLLLSQPNEHKGFFMGVKSSKREPINIQEQKHEGQYLTNKKVPNQNTYQYELLTNNDNDSTFLVNTGIMSERSQKIIADKKSSIEHKQEDNSKIEAITPDVIKKLADTVKTIVLKDLKSEQSTTRATTTPTTATTTRTTTETATQTTAKTTTQTTTKPTYMPTITANEISSTTAKEDHVKIQEASKALEQFMKVFEQFKTMKNQIKSPCSVLETKNVNVVNNEKPANNLTNWPYPPIVNYYGTRSSISKTKAIVLDPYTDKVTPNPFTIQNKPPTNNIFAPQPGQALTIQTNYDVIPPLNIPLPNPLVQTLIITTKSPFIMGQSVPYQSNNHNSQRKPDRYQAQKFELHSAKPSKHRNYREPFHFKFEEKSSPRNIRTHNKPYMPRTHRADQKFHDMLERELDDRTRLMLAERKCFGSEATCNERVAKREQRPLARAPSTYDDSHFRNFLKTQQKVNDMLERILATKTKYENRPPSGEII